LFFNLIGPGITLDPGNGRVVSMLCTAFIDITTFPYQVFALEEGRSFMIPTQCFIAARTPDALDLTFVHDRYMDARETVTLRRVGSLQLVQGI
jgi:hypothetical protein